jgi:hypothetical protein
MELRPGMEVEVVRGGMVLQSQISGCRFGDFLRFTLSSGRVLELTHQHLLETRHHGFDFADQVQRYNFVSVVDSTADSVHAMKWEDVVSVKRIQRVGVFSPITLN